MRRRAVASPPSDAGHGVLRRAFTLGKEHETAHKRGERNGELFQNEWQQPPPGWVRAPLT